MPSPALAIRVESPRTPDVVALLERHLAFSYATTAPEHVFALDLDGLDVETITFVTARALYERCGFTPCGPFADYPDAPSSAFYTRVL